MGCGQSKINLYPRRNKHGGAGKANGTKKTGAGDKEADEEEAAGGATGAAGAAGAGAPAAGGDALDSDKGKHLLPLVSHAAVIEVSASQQDFFKMLDEKIDKGRDYDSSSESEIRAERERRSRLVREWQSTSQSSTQSQPSPPTPARRRPPPPRRAHSAHATHAAAASPPDSHAPARRPHTAAPATHSPQPVRSRNNVSPYCQNIIKNGVIDPTETLSDATDPGPEPSQITYNPTFQTHSPAHAPIKANPALPQQPYIAQIVTYPTVSQTPCNSYISPPDTYREAEEAPDLPEYPHSPRAAAGVTGAAGALPPQSNIYYIHGNVGRQPSPDQTLTQKQQTALHLQQYVAMKQAQQNMFGYLQRVGGAYPGAEFPHALAPEPRPFEALEESYGVAYYAGYRAPPRPRSAPPPTNSAVTVRAGAAPPPAGIAPLVNPVSMFAHIAPMMPPYGHFPSGQFAPSEVQYYQQSQLVHSMYRPGSAGSAGTLTRYRAKERLGTLAPAVAAAGGDSGPNGSNECQSLNIVRHKAVGQIVSLGGQDLGVYQNANESLGAASPGEAPRERPPPPPPAAPNRRVPSDVGGQKCSGDAPKIDKTKNSNGGAVKTRTQKIKINSKSVDSKK